MTATKKNLPTSGKREPEGDCATQTPGILLGSLLKVEFTAQHQALMGR